MYEQMNEQCFVYNYMIALIYIILRNIDNYINGMEAIEGIITSYYVLLYVICFSYFE